MPVNVTITWLTSKKDSDDAIEELTSRNKCGLLHTVLSLPAADIPSTRSKSSLIYYAYAHYSIAAMDKTIMSVYQYEKRFANLPKPGKAQKELIPR